MFTMHVARANRAVEGRSRQGSKWEEEDVEQERTLTVQAEVETNIFRLELQEAQEELRNWDDWYSSGVLPEAEPSLLREEEGYSSLPVIQEHV